MMRAGGFRYYPAKSIADAAAALVDGGAGAMLLAGGTDILPNIKRQQHQPEVLVALRRVAALRGIAANGEVTIGAGTSLRDIARSDLVRGRCEALMRAVAQIATPQIRNSATIGGNLCLDTRCNYYDQSRAWRQAIGFCKKAPGPEGVTVHSPADSDVCWVAPSSARCWAVASSDAAPALIALAARVVLVSRGGERDLPLEALYADDGMSYLTRRPDEILTSILIPSSPVRSTYWKLRRRGSFDFPVLGVAAALSFRGPTVESARVVLGAVASRPLLLEESAQLVGKPLSDDVIESFAEDAARHAKPLDNTDLQMTWRKRVAKEFLAGALRELRGDDPATFGLLAREASGRRPNDAPGPTE